MEHAEQFHTVSHVKSQMMTSGGIRLGELDCKTLNGFLLKFLIELFHLHIYFVANRLVFEGIIEWFSNRTLENRVYALNIRIQEKNPKILYLIAVLQSFLLIT